MERMNGKTARKMVKKNFLFPIESKLKYLSIKSTKRKSIGTASIKYIFK